MSAIHGCNISTDSIVCCLDPSNKGYQKTPFHIQDHSGNGNDGYIAGGTMTTSYYANTCLLYTSPSPRDMTGSRMPSSA